MPDPREVRREVLKTLPPYPQSQDPPGSADEAARHGYRAICIALLAIHEEIHDARKALEELRDI